MTVEAASYRRTLGRFATGVAVVAMEVGDELRAMTVNSFTSVSLEPPLVLFCAGKSSKMGEFSSQASGFSVSILGRDQRDVSSHFAGIPVAAGTPPFGFVTWDEGVRLEGCCAALLCARHAVFDGGDHWIVVGRVVATYEAPPDDDPLLYYRGQYRRLEDVP